MSVQAENKSSLRIFWTFLQLGLTSFGGPVAHIGYFRTRLVERERWMSEQDYAELVALCQFLPGPASSQVGMAIGYRENGVSGALAAFIGFTLPSAIIMALAGYGIAMMQGPIGEGVIHGLKIAAVAVVGHAVWSMANSLCPDPLRAVIALLAAVFILLFPTNISQVLVIIAGGFAGAALISQPGEETRPTHPLSQGEWRRIVAGFGLFFLILMLSPLLTTMTGSQTVALFDAFYRTGALVFGGGHVVLPLLEREVVAPGWVTPDQFLTGYGMAQAIPGPLFTFSAFLGTVSAPSPNGVTGALIALIAIFMPAFLLVVGGLPIWDRLRRDSRLRSALMGTNAAVVGLLLAALYDPVWTSAVLSRADFALAASAFAMLTIWKVSPLWAVVLCAIAGVLVNQITL